MTSYWQASSLLLITVAFNVQGMQLGVLTGLVAQAMILVSLWWWADLNDELRLAPPSALRSSFLTWRALASVAAAGGVLVQAPFQSCVAVPQLAADASCAAWLEPRTMAAYLNAYRDSRAAEGRAAQVRRERHGLDHIAQRFHVDAELLGHNGARLGRGRMNVFVVVAVVKVPVIVRPGHVHEPDQTRAGPQQARSGAAGGALVAADGGGSKGRRLENSGGLGTQHCCGRV